MSLLILQATGLALLFIGNILISDAATRYDARTSWRWKSGNLLQILGFILSLLSIFLQQRNK